MERLERTMREHVVRLLREGAAAGQEHLLEPSATKHLLLIEVSAPLKMAPPPPGTPAAPVVRAAPIAAAPAAPAVGATPPDLTLDEDDEDDEDAEFEEPPEPEIPPPPAPPPGMTDEQFRRSQLDRARAALQGAERAVGAGKSHGGEDVAEGGTRAAGQTPRRSPKSA
jgi:hypothetical protein